MSFQTKLLKNGRLLVYPDSFSLPFYRILIHNEINAFCACVEYKISDGECRSHSLPAFIYRSIRDHQRKIRSDKKFAKFKNSLDLFEDNVGILRLEGGYAHCQK